MYIHIHIINIMYMYIHTIHKVTKSCGYSNEERIRFLIFLDGWSVRITMLQLKWSMKQVMKKMKVGTMIQSWTMHLLYFLICRKMWGKMVAPLFAVVFCLHASMEVWLKFIDPQTSWFGKGILSKWPKISGEGELWLWSVPEVHHYNQIELKLHVH